MKKLLLITLLLLSFSQLQAQENSWNKEPELNISGFLDIFYVYDFNQPQGNQRQNFLYNHNRHNEFNLNLGLVKFSLENDKYRANLALQSGTYANDNYSAEQYLLKNIFEANVGISLNNENSLWLDVGVLPSHIGFESAISTDNMTLTRSLSAENSPYFLSGGKLTYTVNDRLEVVGLVVNGWQRIQRLEGNSLPSFGTQVYYNISENISFNWSTFIGTDTPDSTRRMRYFNNVYTQIKVTDKFELVAGFDVGLQGRLDGTSTYDMWLTPTIIGQYTINDKWKSSIRAEYYQDQSGVIIPTNTINGFETLGFSFNLDYSPTKNVISRIEGRWLNSKDDIFENNNFAFSNNNFIIATSIALKFNQNK